MVLPASAFFNHTLFASIKCLPFDCIQLGWGTSSWNQFYLNKLGSRSVSNLSFRKGLGEAGWRRQFCSLGSILSDSGSGGSGSAAGQPKSVRHPSPCLRPRGPWSDSTRNAPPPTPPTPTHPQVPSVSGPCVPGCHSSPTGQRFLQTLTPPGAPSQVLPPTSPF